MPEWPTSLGLSGRAVIRASAVARAFACAVLLALGACATAADRPAQSSYGCMAAVRATLPPGITDKLAHCLAAGGIAQRCSVFEARLAALAKETRDAFGGGDASVADWRADKAGIACARRSRDANELAACCAAVE